MEDALPLPALELLRSAPRVLDRRRDHLVCVSMIDLSSGSETIDELDPDRPR